jgi:uncharacterized protein YxjI
MLIQIKQHKISLGAKYDILVNGTPRYKAAAKLLQLLSEIHLTTQDGAQVLALKRKPAFLKIVYKITRPTGEEMLFTTKSWWKGHYQCTARTTSPISGSDTIENYDIYRQKGRIYSVYRNDQQVAWWTKKAFSVLAGDEYTITVNDDADLEMLAIFCLIIDDSTSKRGKGLLNISTFNIGPVAQKFDPQWQPNQMVSSQTKYT